MDRIRTPLLILHAEEDYRCPIGEAEQLFAALKKQGREVVFVRFPEESHDLTRKGKPHHRLEHLQWVVRWFADHLGREPVPAPVRELAGVVGAEGDAPGVEAGVSGMAGGAPGVAARVPGAAGGAPEVAAGRQAGTEAGLEAPPQGE